MRKTPPLGFEHLRARLCNLGRRGKSRLGAHVERPFFQDVKEQQVLQRFRTQASARQLMKARAVYISTCRGQFPVVGFQILGFAYGQGLRRSRQELWPYDERVVIVRK
jgi:hypothetical protein